MNAVLRLTPAPTVLRPMRTTDVDAVMAIEVRAYAVPWTRGNFIDSLAAGHPAFLLLAGPDGELLGYFVAMEGVEELHLLNLTVALPHQGRGHGSFLLDALAQLARDTAALTVWLEVRASNSRAQALYRRHGYLQVGLRRSYYPLPLDLGGREDAVVMRQVLHAPEAAP